MRGVGGGAGEVGEVVGDGGLGDDLGEHLLAVGLGPLLGGEHERAGAVVDARRVAGGVRAVLADEAGQLGERLQRVSRRGASSTSTTVSPLRPLMVTGTISSGRRPSSVAAIVRSCERSAQRSMSARVISSSSPTSVASSNICLPVKGLRQAVVDHRVERLDVAHAEAEARAWAAGRAPATSTPCRRRRRPRGRRRGSPGRSCPAARMPDAQTLLIVSEETSFGMPGLDLRLARGDLALARPAAPGPSRRAGPARARPRRARARPRSRCRRARWRAGWTGRRPACRRGCGRRRG